MSNEEIIAEIGQDDLHLKNKADKSLLLEALDKAHTEGKREVRAAFYKLDWIKILNSAIESRRSSFGERPVIEWRNASDEVMVAVLRALEDEGIFEQVFKQKFQKEA